MVPIYLKLWSGGSFGGLIAQELAGMLGQLSDLH